MLGAFLTFAVVAQAEPVFLGYMITRDEGARFVVAASATEPGRWLKIGDSVGGYVLAEYRRDDETVVLKKADGFLVVSLRKTRVSHAPAMVEPQRLIAALDQSRAGKDEA